MKLPQLQASSRMAAHDRRRRHSNPAVLDSLSSLASVVSGSGGRLSPHSSFTSVGPTTPASQSHSPRLFVSDSFTLGDRRDRKEAFIETVKLGRHGSLNKIMSPVNKIKESLKVTDLEYAYLSKAKEAFISFKCHKVIVASHSSFLKSMFTGGFRESVSNTNVVTLEGVDSWAFRHVLDYIYHGEVNVEIERIVELAVCADQIGMALLKEELCAAAYDTIIPSNSCTMFVSADMGGLFDLRNKCKQYCLQNFSLIASSKDLFVLDVLSLSEFIQSEELVVNSELTVYDAVSKYIAKQETKEAQERCSTILLPHVRFALMSNSILAKNIMSDPTLAGNLKLKELVLDAFTYLSLPAAERKEADKTSRTKRRKGMGCDIMQTELAYTLEGHEGNITCAIGIDDKYFATGSEDGTIKIWNGVSQICEKTLAQHIDDIRAIILVSDKLISGSADGTIKVWDFKSGWTCDRTLSGFGETSTFSSFKKSSTKTYLVAGNSEGNLHIWNMLHWTSKKCSAHQNSTSNFAIKALCTTSSYVISTAEDRTINVWDSSLGPVANINNLADVVHSMTMLNDNIFAAGFNNGMIFIWSIPTFEHIHSFSGHSTCISQLLLSGTTLISASDDDGVVKAWNTASWAGDVVPKINIKDGILACWGDVMVFSCGSELHVVK